MVGWFSITQPTYSTKLHYDFNLLLIIYNMGLRGARNQPGPMASGGPYLRGSLMGIRTYKKPTLTNKVARLERQVASQKPELHQYPNAYTANSSGSGFNFLDRNITRDFIDSSNFRDNVNGDRFRQRGLKIYLHGLSGAVFNFRVVVYVNRRASTTTFTPTSIGQIYDITATDLLYDQPFQKLYNAGQMLHKVYVPMNRICMYNSDSDIIDKNGIRIVVMWQTTSGAATPDVAVDYALMYSDM